MLKKRRSKYYKKLIELLTNFPETRYSDFVLFNKFLEVVMKYDTHRLSAHDLLIHMDKGKIPKWNSIGRERQKIQKEYPSLDCPRRSKKSMEKKSSAHHPTQNIQKTSRLNRPQLQPHEQVTTFRSPAKNEIDQFLAQPEQKQQPVKKNKITTPLPPYKPRW